MNANSSTVRSRMPGAPNRSKKLWVCDSPSKMIDDTPNATSVTSAADQPGSSRPLPNATGMDPPLLVDQPPVGEAAEQSGTRP